MDPILAAERLPKLAERAMRAAVAAAVSGGRRTTPRALVDDALIRFERAVQRVAGDGIRPALLFAERDRIVRELRGFVEGRLAARLFSLRRRDLLAAGRRAAPFDALVRGRRGGTYAVVFRRLCRDGRRLETMQAIANAAHRHAERIAGVLVYDFTTATVRRLRGTDRGVESSAA